MFVEKFCNVEKLDSGIGGMGEVEKQKETTMIKRKGLVATCLLRVINVQPDMMAYGIRSNLWALI